MTSLPASPRTDTPPNGQDDRRSGETLSWLAPLRATNPRRALGRYLRRYASFAGRSSRSEYWWIALFNVLVLFGGSLLMLLVQSATSESLIRDDVSIGAGLVGTALALWFLATFIPGLALGVRRLHDLNLSGWFILLNIVPFVGLVLTLLPPDPAGSRFDR